MGKMLKKYIEADKKLVRLRELQIEPESAEENDLLEELDSLWWQLTPEERDEVSL
jgi:hypothetical protein